MNAIFSSIGAVIKSLAAVFDVRYLLIGMLLAALSLNPVILYSQEAKPAGMDPVQEIIDRAAFYFERENWKKAAANYRLLLKQHGEHALVKPQAESLKIKILFAEFSQEFRPSAELWESVFNGKVLDFIPRANMIEVEYRFKDKKELADFNFARLTANGMRPGQNVQVRFQGMGKYNNYATLNVVPFHTPWQVEMVVQEQGPPGAEPSRTARRGGAYLRFGNEKGAYGYIYGVDTNYHDGRMSAPHGILKYHPEGLHKWDFICSDFAPRLPAFQEMKIKVICRTNGEMAVKVGDKTILSGANDSYKKGWLHFGPGNINFKYIRIKGIIEATKARSLISELQELAWAERLKEFKKENGIIAPDREIKFIPLTDAEALELIDYKPPAPGQAGIEDVPTFEAAPEGVRTKEGGQAPESAPGPEEEVEDGDEQEITVEGIAPGDAMLGQPFGAGLGIFYQAEEDGLEPWGMPAEEPDEEEDEGDAWTVPAEPEEPEPAPQAPAEELPKSEEPPDEAKPAKPVHDPRRDGPLFLAYAAGQKLRAARKYKAAIARFDEVLGYNAQSVPALYERAYCRYMLEENAKCLADIALIEQLEFSYESLEFIKLRLSLAGNDWRAGTAALENISEESPYYPFAMLARGWFHYLQHEFNQAFECLDEAVRLDPELSGAAAWYRDRIEAFRNGPHWVDNFQKEGKTCRVYTGLSKKAARVIAQYVDSLYNECDNKFGFLKIKADRKSGRESAPLSIYYFTTDAGLKTYLDRIVIGREKLEDGMHIVYDRQYRRVYFSSPFDNETFKEAVANIAVMTYLRNLAIDFPPWFENGLSFYHENSLIAKTDRGMFNLAGSNVALSLFSQNKQRDLMRYYLHLTKEHSFPLVYFVKKRQFQIDAVVPPRTRVEAPGTFTGFPDLLELDDKAFNANFRNNKIESGFFVYYLFGFRGGFYREFLAQYLRNLHAGMTPAAILKDEFPDGYIKRLLKIKDWYLLNLWQNTVCRDRAIPPEVLLGKSFKGIDGE